MANDGEINSEEFLPKELLAAPLVLTKNIEVSLVAVGKLTAKTLELSAALKNEKASLTDINKITKELNGTENELIETQKKLAKTVQDETAVMGKQDKQLVKLQQELAKLRTEQERQSKEGKKLIDTISKQNAELKRLEDQAKKAEKAQHDLADQVDILDSRMGGFISTIKKTWKELATLATNPWFLAAAALVAIFQSLKSAADAYYSATMEGEEELAASEARNKAFFDEYRKEWLSLGKVVAAVWEQAQFMIRETIALIQDDDTTKNQIKNENELLLIEQERFALRNEHLRDQIDDSKTELEVQGLLEKAKDKDDVVAKERLAALLKGNEKLREQEEGDLELAKRDLQLQKDIIQYESNKNKGIYDQTRSISELTDAEIKQIDVEFKEIKKLADLETALTKVETDAGGKRLSRLKVEIALRKEVEDENKKEIEFQKLLYQLINKAGMASGELAQRLADSPKNALDLLKEYSADATNIEVKGAADRVEITKKEFEAKTELIEKYAKAQGEAIQLEDIEGMLQDALEVYNEFYSAVGALQSTFTANTLQGLKAQSDALAAQKDAELKIAGDNADAKDKIEQRYGERQKELKREQAVAANKQAKFDKATALIQAVIKESLLIIEALLAPTPGRIAAAFAGGIQVAAIGAKEPPPVPAYAKGTKGTPKSGYAWVGEQGIELVEKPGESPLLSPAKPTLMYLPKDTKVSTHQDTVKKLATTGLHVDRVANNMDLVDIKRELAKQTQVIKDKPFVQANITEGGVRLVIQQAARKEHRLGTLYQ